MQLVDQLFKTPTVTIAMIGRELGITYPSAKKNVARFVNAGILTPLGDDNYGRAFCGVEILDILREE